MLILTTYILSQKLIFHILKEQSISWHRVASIAAALTLNHSTQTILCQSSTPNINKSTHHSAYHITQESIG